MTTRNRESVYLLLDMVRENKRRHLHSRSLVHVGPTEGKKLVFSVVFLALDHKSQL